MISYLISLRLQNVLMLLPPKLQNYGQLNNLLLPPHYNGESIPLLIKAQPFHVYFSPHLLLPIQGLCIFG